MKKMLSLAAALLLVAGAAWAQPGPDKDCCPPDGPGMHGMGMMDCGPGPMGGMERDDDGDGPIKGLLRDVDLTDEQEGKLEKLQLDNQKKMVERKAQMVEYKSKLQLAMITDKYSEKDIKEIAGKLADFHKEGIILHAALVRAIRDMLTDPQRVQFDQNVLAAGKGMGMGPGRGMMKRWGMGWDCGPGWGGPGPDHPRIMKEYRMEKEKDKDDE